MTFQQRTEEDVAWCSACDMSSSEKTCCQSRVLQETLATVQYVSSCLAKVFLDSLEKSFAESMSTQWDCCLKAGKEELD